MSKVKLRSVNRAVVPQYVYKMPKSVKAYGGGCIVIRALDDEFSKVVERQNTLIASNAHAAPEGVPDSGMYVRGHDMVPAVRGEYVAAPVARKELIPLSIEYFENPITIDDLPLWQWISQHRVRANILGAFDEMPAVYEWLAFSCASKPSYRIRFAKQEWALASTRDFFSEESDSNWAHEPEGILNRLENKEYFPDDYDAAVLFAEVKPFRGEQKTRLLQALSAYIEENRFAEDQDSLITLCSAIRKYAMNMTETCFEHYADWLIPTETATLHHEAEMEFTKGICWRLEFEPHTWPAEYPILTKTLFDLVDSYLTPRLILQKSYANTAMFGMVALHVLEAISTSRKKSVGNLRRKMVETGVKWFVEMVDDNVDEAIHYIYERDADLAKKVSEIRQG